MEADLERREEDVAGTQEAGDGAGSERNLGYPAPHLLMAGTARGEELIRCINR